MLQWFVMNGTLHVQSIYCYYQNAPFNRVTLMNAGLFDLEMTYDIAFIRVFRDGPLEKLWGGEGNFRAAGIFFRHQIPCMNFF